MRTPDRVLTETEVADIRTMHTTGLAPHWLGIHEARGEYVWWLLNTIDALNRTAPPADAPKPGHCVRCGKPYDANGRCTDPEHCQGGWGENQQPYDRKPADAPARERAVRLCCAHCGMAECQGECLNERR